MELAIKHGKFDLCSFNLSYLDEATQGIWKISRILVPQSTASKG